jgi:halogenation protein CepH
VNTLLAAGASLEETSCFSEYERRYRREFGLFYQFLVSFYDIHHNKDSYFWMARKVLGTEEMANEAFVRLVGGVASRDFFQSCEKLSSVLTTHASRPESISDEFFKEFDSEFFKEQARMMWPGAVKGDTPTREAPLFADGLIPSSDGLHWIQSEAAAAVYSAATSTSSVGNLESPATSP